MNREQKRKLVGLGVSLIGAVSAPLMAHELLRWDHSRAYRGTCGPHAPDISVHACSYQEHMAEFGAGFAGVGLLFVEGLAFVIALVVIATVWAIVAWRARRRRSA